MPSAPRLEAGAVKRVRLVFLVRLEVEEVPAVMRAMVRAEVFRAATVVEDTVVEGVAKGKRELIDRGRK
jgi:hypothetical protein